MNRMKGENKTKAELIKELKTLRKEREKGVFKNIGEHKKTDKGLKESEEKYLRLLENMMDGLVLHRLITDKNDHPVDYILEKVNKAAEKILSWNRKDIEGKKATEVYSGDAPFVERYAKVAQTGKAEYFIDYYPRFKKWYEINSFCPEKGYFANIFRDVTERKQAEEQIKDSEERLKILFDYAPDAYYISDLKGNFIDGNIAAERVIGYKREELIGSSFLKLKLLSLADIPKAAKLLVKNLRGQPTGPDEFILNQKDNSKVTVEISTYPVKIKGKTLVLGIARDITERKQVEGRLKKTMDATIDTMSKIIEAKDPYTFGHQHRVCQLAVYFAQELGLAEDKVEGIRIASLIHDIGKIGLPTEILSKPTKLTDMQFSLIKGHSQIGYDILKSIDFSFPIARIVLQHHERLNGSGYPNNLKGNEIILEAKIIGVADVVEAMSSHRPYRPALGIDKALEEITQNKGTLYDPEVVDACLRLFKEKGFKFE